MQVAEPLIGFEYPMLTRQFEDAETKKGRPIQAGLLFQPIDYL
jgi:hypothetical protein